MIGSALSESLRAEGTGVTALVRRPPRDGSGVQGESEGASARPDVLAGVDAVIALRGKLADHLDLVQDLHDAGVERHVATKTNTHPRDARVLVAAQAYGNADAQLRDLPDGD